MGDAPFMTALEPKEGVGETIEMANPGPPSSFGIEGALAKLRKHQDEQLAHLTQLVKAGFARLERIEKLVMTQLEELDAKLDAIAANETKLGEDIRNVIAAIKNLPGPTPPDISTQLAKLDNIAQSLIDTDAEVLSNLPPVPEPAPGSGRK